MAIDKKTKVQKLLTLTHEQAARVKDFRFNSRIESETEAYRRVIDAGLDVLTKPKPKRK